MINSKLVTYWLYAGINKTTKIVPFETGYNNKV